MRLSNLPGRIATHTGLRHLLFLVSALFSILLIGYHFGTFDQVVHIPFMKAEADPSLYPGDALVALRNTPYSYFWVFFIPFYRWGMLEVAMFVVHILATYLTFWGIWSLSITLFKDSLAGLLSVLAFIFPHFGFLGFPVIEFSLLNRTFVLPFLLFAIIWFMQKHYRRAFFLLGVASNLHALSAGMVMGMLIFAALMEVRRVGAIRFIQSALFAILGAVPVLLMIAGNGQLVDWSLRPEWLSIVANGILYQVFYPFSTIPYILLLTLGGFSAGILFFIARQAYTPTLATRTMERMLIAAGIIFTVGILTAQYLPVTILIKLQLNRVSLFILIFAYLSFANYLAKQAHNQQMVAPHIALLTGIFLISAVPILPLAIWGLLRWLKPRQMKWGWVAAGIAGSLGVFVAIALALDIWFPGIYVFPRRTTWLDAQEWARENTPRETVFITPPEKGGIYEPEWRVFSERSSVVSVIDLLEVALAPQYLDTWTERFEALAPGVIEQFTGIYFESDALASHAFYSLSDQALLKVADIYQAGYLVVEKPHVRDFPLIYENQDYIIYQLP